MLKMIINNIYILKRNLNYENQIIFLMIPNGERWNYLAVKLEQHKTLCEDKIFAML